MIDSASNAGTAYSNRKMPENLTGRSLRRLRDPDKTPMKHCRGKLKTAEKLKKKAKRND
jgi:hypothetical protein